MKHKYLFYVAKQYSIPIIKPLADYLNKHGYEYALYISNKVRNKLGDEWKSVPQFTEIEQAIRYNPDFSLTPGNFIDFRIPGIKVQIFHGMGVEKESHYKIRHFFDVYLTSGPVVTERFNKLQKKYKYFLVRETGWPKVDYILKQEYKNLREKYGIQNNKKVILYAPTFSRKMESASSLLPEISGNIKDGEIWLLKFHELMKKDTISQVGVLENDNVRLIETHDITPLLHLADCMISDTSSVLYEFMALGKPVITYRTQGRPEKGIDIQEPSQLREALDRSLENGITEQSLLCLKEVIPYLDGQISENVFKELEKIKSENLLPKKRKRSNLFRKMQILYHEKYKKGYLR